MKTQKTKGVAAAKRTVANRETFDGPSGAHFSFLVESETPIVVADNVSRYVILKNHGPGMMLFSVSHGLVQKLVPGGLWVTAVIGDLAIGSRNGERALVEIEFLPKSKRF